MAVRAEVLARLFEDDRDALRRYVRRLLGSHEGSEDIVQEAFLRTCRHAGDIAEPRAFVFTIARNLAADFRRHGRIAKTETLGDLDVSNVVSPTGSVESTLLAAEQDHLLREAVERLSPQCRSAFALRVFHDCSYKEIARQLGITPKTVENHIARAVRETHRFLRERYQLNG